MCLCVHGLLALWSGGSGRPARRPPPVGHCAPKLIWGRCTCAGAVRSTDAGVTMARTHEVQLERRTATHWHRYLTALGGPAPGVLLGVVLGAIALAAVILLPLLARAAMPAVP